jgi:DUF1680 family protein
VSGEYLRASIDGGFWGGVRRLVRDRVLPYQWNALNDRIPGAPRSHSIENFRIAAGASAGEYEGFVFQDSDLYKWLEAAGAILGDGSPEENRIRGWIGEAVDVIAAAQQPDGYLNTYFTVKEPAGRWKNLRETHELYCAGHLIEAAVAVHRAAGNEKILSVARRLADHIDSRFGIGDGKVRGYCGHEEVELALVKLYSLTGEKRYLSLASYFIDERGRSPSYFTKEAAAPDYRPVWGSWDGNLAYTQAHAPVREQTEAVGHAVRAMYLSTAMADLALRTKDADLARACERLWENATGRRMYVTGGVGSSAKGEAFTFDFDLPNDTAYAETCASIGLFFFSHRMAVLTGRARYADAMERTLYNGILSGISLDGASYFYVNPLEVLPAACEGNPAYRHVKYRRQPWFGCACCPPNLARLFASLGEYAYHADDSTLHADLFHTGTIAFEDGGRRFALRQTTGYPWEGSVAFEITEAGSAELDLAIRLPGWCKNPALALNGKPLDAQVLRREGYAHVSRAWRKGDRLELFLPMEALRVRADRRVRADAGKVAVQRGPVVYCLEEEDNGPDLHEVTLPADAALREERRPDLLGGIVAVNAVGRSPVGDNPSGRSPEAGAEALYRIGGPHAALRDRPLLFIPYSTWANRGPGEMTVWVRE